jgi:hypothetical protein
MLENSQSELEGNVLGRRKFVKVVAGAGCALMAETAWSSSPSKNQTEGYRLVARTDRERILLAAQQCVDLKPVTITSFPAARSAGGPHDYFSQADYFWPNPQNPNGPYVNRDGQSNPDNFDLHRKVMIALSKQMPSLTAAWMLTGERRYAERACDHLTAWFVTPESRMNPNLQYAQAVIGVSTGRSYGIIDTLHLVEVARAASLVAPTMMNPTDRAAMIDWFARYLDWLSTSAPGQTERDAKNNHAICWALQAAEFARLAGNQTVRSDVYRRYREILLPDQEAIDGSFPKELARTKPYSYSIFNFDVMAGLCQSLKDLVPDATQFALADGRGLRKAAEFIYPYIEDKSTWKWARDVEHFDALPVRSPGLLFAGLAYREPQYLELWKKLNPDPADKEIVRNYPIRQPLLWV